MSLPILEAWIEVRKRVKDYISIASRFLYWKRGLKFICYSSILFVDFVASYTGSVD